MLPSSADMNVPTPTVTRTHQRFAHSGGGSLDAIGELPRGEPRRGEVFGTPLLDARPAPTKLGTGNREQKLRGASVPGSQFPVPRRACRAPPIPTYGCGVRSCPFATGLTPNVRDTLPVLPALSVTRAVTVTVVFPAGMTNLPPATHDAVVVTPPLPR